jgi:hypothetical protein
MPKPMPPRVHPREARFNGVPVVQSTADPRLREDREIREIHNRVTFSYAQRKALGLS